MKKIIFNSAVSRFAALIVVDGLFFGLTDPANVPSFGLVIGFLLFSVTFYQSAKGLYRLGNWYGLTTGKGSQRFARLLTVVFAGIVALQSMGQLGGLDLLVLFPLAFIVYLYLSYGKPVTDTARLQSE